MGVEVGDVPIISSVEGSTCFQLIYHDIGTVAWELKVNVRYSKAVKKTVSHTKLFIAQVKKSWWAQV